MASKRKLPRGAKAARRPLSGGGSADGYILGGVFTPFESVSGQVYAGIAYPDSTVPCESAPSGGGYDSGAGAGGGSDSGSGSAPSGD
jgi:hypothetical protein